VVVGLETRQLDALSIERPTHLLATDSCYEVTAIARARRGFLDTMRMVAARRRVAGRPRLGLGRLCVAAGFRRCIDDGRGTAAARDSLVEGLRRSVIASGAARSARGARVRSSFWCSKVRKQFHDLGGASEGQAGERGNRTPSRCRKMHG